VETLYDALYWRQVNSGVRQMNVMDRSVMAAADQKPKQQAKLALRQRQRRIAIGVALIVAVAAAAYYVWATTLCGDCGGLPVPLPTPPA
jgi:hypothetical protein